MAEMKSIPSVIAHKFTGTTAITGVAPVDTGAKWFEFNYANEVGGPLEVGETLSWAGPSTGTLRFLDDSSTNKKMVIELLTGSAPANGDTLTGGSSGATGDVVGEVGSGFDSGEWIQRGRYREYRAISDGGLIELPQALDGEGFKIVNILINCPGVTAIDFRIEDPSGSEYSADSITLTSGAGYKEWRNGGLLVAPGCKFRVVGTGNRSGDGQIMFVLGKGWGQNLFAYAGGIGVGNSPPAMQRT